MLKWIRKLFSPTHLQIIEAAYWLVMHAGDRDVDQRVFYSEHYTIFTHNNDTTLNGIRVVIWMKGNMQVADATISHNFYGWAWEIERFHEGAWCKALMQDYKRLQRKYHDRLADDTAERFKPLDE